MPEDYDKREAVDQHTCLVQEAVRRRDRLIPPLPFFAKRYDQQDRREYERVAIVDARMVN